MGLVMYLGPELVRTGGRSALAQCARLPTRMREYTCIHGLGHALMRGYHGQLRSAVRACRALGPNGVDCAQGAFHDYWISLRGADGTTKPTGAAMSPRRLCDGRLTYVRPCWYRYFIEQRTGPVLNTADDIRHVCRGLRPMQRSGASAAPRSRFRRTRSSRPRPARPSAAPTRSRACAASQCPASAPSRPAACTDQPLRAVRPGVRGVLLVVRPHARARHRRQVREAWLHRAALARRRRFMPGRDRQDRRAARHLLLVRRVASSRRRSSATSCSRRLTALRADPRPRRAPGARPPRRRRLGRPSPRRCSKRSSFCPGRRGSRSRARAR